MTAQTPLVRIALTRYRMYLLGPLKDLCKNDKSAEKSRLADLQLLDSVERLLKRDGDPG